MSVPILNPMDEIGILTLASTLIGVPSLPTVGQAGTHPLARPVGMIDTVVRIEFLHGAFVRVPWNAWIGQATGLARERAQCLAGGPCPLVHTDKVKGGTTALRSNGQWNNVTIVRKRLPGASVLGTNVDRVLAVVRRVIVEEDQNESVVFIPAPFLVLCGESGPGIFAYAQERNEP